MALSVNTNAGALVALQNLNKTNSELNQVQLRINTGLAVASAKDNGAIFAIAQDQRAEVRGLSVAQQSIDRAVSTLDVAIAGAESISDLLVELKEKAIAAKDASLTTNQRAAYNADFVALRKEVAKVIATASFNGTNLINSDSINVLANGDGSSVITISRENLSLGGTILTFSATTTIGTVALASAAVLSIDRSLDRLNQSLARLGTGAKTLEVHKSLLGKLSDALTTGIGNLVDADLAKESARLQALQVKQQLGVQALSIANSSTGTVLSFFR